MNEDQTTLNPVGDDAMEARIVAWVLGQASAFEAAELETWCETHPEWRVYQRRMLALHGLLDQAVQPSCDTTWKLSDHRRAALDGILGTKDVVAEAKQQTRKKRWWPQLAKFAALLLVFLSVAYTAFLGIFGKVGGKVSMSQEVASYSREKPVEMNAPMAPSVELGNSDDFADGWDRQEDRDNTILAKRMAAAAPADAAATEAGAFGGGGGGETLEFRQEAIAKQEDQMAAVSERTTSSGALAVSSLKPSAPSSRAVVVSEAKPDSVSSLLSDGSNGGNVTGGKGVSVIDATKSVASDELAVNGRGAEIETAVGQKGEKSEPLMEGNGVYYNRIEERSREASPPLPKEPELAESMSRFSRGVQDEKGADALFDAPGAAPASGKNELDGVKSSPVPLVNSPTGAITGETLETEGLQVRDEGLKVQDDLANIVSASAVELKEQLDTKSESFDFKTLEKAVIAQNDIVEAKRKERDGLLRRAPAIVRDSITKDMQSQLASPLSRSEQLVEASTTRHQELTGILKTMDTLTTDELMRYVSNLEDASPELKTKYLESRDTTKKIDEKKRQGMSDNHSEVQVLKKALNEKNQALQADIASMKYRLTVQREAEAAKIDAGVKLVELLKQNAESSEKLMKEVTNVQSDFTREVDRLELMKSKLEVLQKESSLYVDKALPIPDEIATIAEAYSTFSLRVSDASFKLAQAALARGERPAPESVRVEEFYNAFDYGDPVPSAKEPVSCFMEQSAHPILPSRNLLRVSMRTAAAGRGAGQPLHLTLLVDQSGSMVRADRAEVMSAAIAELTTLLGPQDKVSIIGFARQPRLIAENIPGNDGAQIRKILQNIPSDGGTNLEEAMMISEQIARRNFAAGAQNRILLMTDGAANLGNAKPDNLSERVKTMRQNGLAFDIAGIGTDGLNDNLLLELARHGNGRYYVVNRLADTGPGFAQQLAGAFRPAAENVKVQVHFNPLRVSRYRLIGFEKDRLKTEDFRNDAVDAAELAAAEAGNAMYQMEILPEGEGDIGEVSVRFRDTVSGQMVERKWTILYQASTPAFDRAAPSMQLAGLSLLLAEKLRGSSIGEMVQFKDWNTLRVGVQQSFQQTPRVAELMEMIRKVEP